MFALVKKEMVTNPFTNETSEVESIRLFSSYSLWEDKNGTQYSPSTLTTLSTDQKQDLGIYDVAYATRSDDRFYSVTENAPVFDSAEKIVKVTFTSTPKQLEDGEVDVVTGKASAGLKTQWTNQFKTNANLMLTSTDWMLVRKIERQIDVPAETTTLRTAIVAETTRLETAIAAATTVQELIAAVESANFVG